MVYVWEGEGQGRTLENEAENGGRRFATALCWSLVDSLAAWCGVGGHCSDFSILPLTVRNSGASLDHDRPARSVC